MNYRYIRTCSRYDRKNQLATSTQHACINIMSMIMPRSAPRMPLVRSQQAAPSSPSARSLECLGAKQLRRALRLSDHRDVCQGCRVPGGERSYPRASAFHGTAAVASALGCVCEAASTCGTPNIGRHCRVNNVCLCVCTACRVMCPPFDRSSLFGPDYITVGSSSS